MRLRSAVAFCIAILLSSAAAADVTYYVSHSGNDNWSGGLPDPNANRTDGPFATLARAQTAVRQARAANPSSGSITVSIREGVYTLAAPLQFTDADSGRAGGPVIWQAYGSENVVLSGGTSITGWQQGAGSVWTAHVTGAFHELFVDGQRRQRARTPNSGYLYTQGYWPGIDDPTKTPLDPIVRLGFRYHGGDLDALGDWSDVNLMLFGVFGSSMHTIAELSTANHTVKLTAPTTGVIGEIEPYLRHKRYFVENYPGALDAPGEWYLDRTSGTLSYIPLPGEDPRSINAIAPALRHVVVFSGSSSRPVHDVVLRRLSLQYTDWNLAPDSAMTGTYDLGSGAVELHWTNNIELDDCEIAHTGDHALFMDGSHDDVLHQLHLWDLGAGGMYVNGYAQSADHNTIADNLIHDGGKVFPAAPGILLYRGSFNVISHNDVSAFYGGGIQVVGTIGYGQSLAHDNLVDANRIHDIGRGVFSDIGAIYTAGESPNTVVRGNVIEGVHSYTYGANGLYTDEGSSGITVAGNRVRDVGVAYQHHYGKDNVVDGNVFVSRDAALNISDAEATRSVTFTNNSVVPGNGQVFDVHTSATNVAFDENTYWACGDSLRFQGLSFAEWQAAGQDAHSSVTGVRPSFDMSGAGLEGDWEWRSLPRRVLSPQTLFEPTPGWNVDDEDFENEVTGDLPGYANVFGERDGAAVRVTNAEAAAGRQSLAFTSAASTQPYSLVMAYVSHLVAGTAFVSFDLRMDGGRPALIATETRGVGQPMNGPNIYVAQNGDLVANGRVLMNLPSSQWIHLGLVISLGTTSGRTYTAEVTVPGQAARRFDGLPFDSPAFSRITYLAVSNAAPSAGVFYLDNIRWGTLPSHRRAVVH